MIDINDLRRLAQAALVAPDGLSAEWMDRLGQFQESVSPAAIIELLDRLEAAEKERDALRAKIEQMEKQEPVAWLHETRRDSDVVTDAVKHVWGKVAVGSMAAYSIPLYALPGAQAQPAPSARDIDYLVDMLSEFADHNVEFGRMSFDKWTLRNAVEAVLATAPEATP